MRVASFTGALRPQLPSKRSPVISRMLHADFAPRQSAPLSPALQTCFTNRHGTFGHIHHRVTFIYEGGVFTWAVTTSVLAVTNARNNDRSASSSCAFTPDVHDNAWAVASTPIAARSSGYASRLLTVRMRGQAVSGQKNHQERAISQYSQ